MSGYTTKASVPSKTAQFAKASNCGVNGSASFYSTLKGDLKRKSYSDAWRVMFRMKSYDEWHVADGRDSKLGEYVLANAKQGDVDERAARQAHPSIRVRLETHLATNDRGQNPH